MRNTAVPVITVNNWVQFMVFIRVLAHLHTLEPCEFGEITLFPLWLLLFVRFPALWPRSWASSRFLCGVLQTPVGKLNNRQNAQIKTEYTFLLCSWTIIFTANQSRAHKSGTLSVILKSHQVFAVTCVNFKLTVLVPIRKTCYSFHLFCFLTVAVIWSLLSPFLFCVHVSILTYLMHTPPPTPSFFISTEIVIEMCYVWPCVCVYSNSYTPTDLRCCLSTISVCLLWLVCGVN